MGLNISGLILGYPVTENIVSRIVVGLSMMLGVMVAGLIFALAGTAAGWIIGNILGAFIVRTGNDTVDSDKKVDAWDGFCGPQKRTVFSNVWEIFERRI